MVGVGLDGPLVHLLRPIRIATHNMKKTGVVAEAVGVVGVGFDGPPVHFLRPVVITTRILQEPGVVNETADLGRIGGC